jgi:hypothetical protein
VKLFTSAPRHITLLPTRSTTEVSDFFAVKNCIFIVFGGCTKLHMWVFCAVYKNATIKNCCCWNCNCRGITASTMGINAGKHVPPLAYAWYTKKPHSFLAWKKQLASFERETARAAVGQLHYMKLIFWYRIVEDNAHAIQRKLYSLHTCSESESVYWHIYSHKYLSIHGERYDVECGNGDGRFWGRESEKKLSAKLNWIFAALTQLTLSHFTGIDRSKWW